MIYKRSVTLRETLAPGLLLSPSLEIPVSSDNGRIMPGQVELDKTGSSLMGATCRDVHPLSSLPFPSVPPSGSSVAIPVTRGQEDPPDRGVGIKALVKWPFGKPWPSSD